jgi:hypothetical protein
MGEILKENKLAVAGTAVGAIIGWLYWKLIGCDSGSCAITSDPLKSTIYGAVMTGLLASIFEHRDK